MPRACDEAFCDAFLSGSGVHQYAVFDRHVHKIRAIKPSKSEMLTGKESPTKRKKNRSTSSSSSSSSSNNNKVTDKDALEAKMAADGWTKEEKKREGSDHVDKYWIDPAGGKKCRSIVEVARKAYPEFLKAKDAKEVKAQKIPGGVVVSNNGHWHYKKTINSRFQKEGQCHYDCPGEKKNCRTYKAKEAEAKEDKEVKAAEKEKEKAQQLMANSVGSPCVLKKRYKIILEQTWQS